MFNSLQNITFSWLDDKAEMSIFVTFDKCALHFQKYFNPLSHLIITDYDLPRFLHAYLLLAANFTFLLERTCSRNFSKR